MLHSQLIHADGARSRARVARHDLRIQKRADRLLGWWARIVVAATVLAIGIWTILDAHRALGIGLAVLIAGNPCALFLAPAVALRVALRRARAAGIALDEELFDVDTLFVDKSALTAARPEVVDVVTTGITEHELLRLAAGVECASDHPLARAIVDEATRRGLAIPTATDFAATTHEGVSAIVDGRHVALGNFPYMDELGVDVAPLHDTAEVLRGSGRVVVHVAIDRVQAGLLTIATPVRPEIPATLHALAAAEVRVVLLTGDNRRTAQAFAEDLDIVEVHPEATPDMKRAIIERAPREGHDAIVADDTVDLWALARAMRLRRMTIRTIKQGMWIAALMAAAGVVLAGIGLLDPLSAALVTLAACGLVAVNGLRLHRSAT